jgi:Ser/Thr protein kinase RdoA (MazF antagonist)
MREVDQDIQERLLTDARAVLSAWRLDAGAWRLAGAIPGAQGGLWRPVVETDTGLWLLRKQAPDLTLDDMRFRHAYMEHLANAGLPVPRLLPTTEGRTWAPIQDGIYELQSYLPGDAFASDDSVTRVEDAAVRLGALHQAAASFGWAPHIWPEERSAIALAQAYTGRIRQAASAAWENSQVGRELVRVADACEERIAVASGTFDARPGLPNLHIHGDYLPHNLAFAGAQVCAIYDFDAARWERRIYELAYALVFFTGLGWSEGDPLTPPRVDDGLDIHYAHRFLAAYGNEAPPDEDEADLLGAALALVFPIAFANGVAEDLVFTDDYAEPPSQREALIRLGWAERFWLWLDRYEDALAQAWEGG